METCPESPYFLLAEALSYPFPGRLAALEKGLETLKASRVKRSLAAFVKEIQRLSQGEREELYTRTLDLNPLAAPYIGYQMWGESYQRGAFLAKLNRAMSEAGIDPQGELPDHLIPILHYLGQNPNPLPELVEALEPALRRMEAELRKADSANPYLGLLEAARVSVKA